MSPYTDRARVSYDCRRGVAAVQCTVVPPTVRQCQAGSVGEVLTGSQVPLCERGSSQVSCANASPGFCEKVASDWRLPASNITTLRPRRVSSLAMVPPPAPEPTMTTTSGSLSSKRGMQALPERHRAAVRQRHVGKPFQIVEAAQQVAALGE